MAPTYWVEMTLQVSGDRSVDRSQVEKWMSILDDRHDGQIVYTFSSKTGSLAIAMSASSHDPIEQVSARVVGTVRAVAHDLGFHTPGWPEPVTIDDVRIKTLIAESATC